MRVLVRKWGNSAAVRIRASVMQAARLRLDEAVDVRQESGRIIIEPLQHRGCDFDELVGRITPQNSHEEIKLGGPVGKEAW